ncbi:hypothetical protein F2Q69_00011885 [Brassica cretica]|uniref:Uncharacterized protein n=1 Tax=Brassica cretica TaxID=69181 RepID=A0A8S9R9L8_BRACR|nr:hypothetical protein F2Q69_00011885 [Brassica cretica]
MSLPVKDPKKIKHNTKPRDSQAVGNIRSMYKEEMKPKSKHQTRTLQPPVEKLLLPELKSDGSLRFPWAARLIPQSRNLYRAASPTYRLDSTPEVSIPSKVLKLGPKNKDEYIIGKFHRCSLPPSAFVFHSTNALEGPSATDPIPALQSKAEAAHDVPSGPSHASENLSLLIMTTTPNHCAFESPSRFTVLGDGDEVEIEPPSSLSLTRGGRESKPPIKYQNMEWQTIRGRGKRGCRGHGSYHLLLSLLPLMASLISTFVSLVWDSIHHEASFMQTLPNYKTLVLSCNNLLGVCPQFWG